MNPVFQAILGVAVFLGCAVLTSRHRGGIRWRRAAIALVAQFLIAAVFLHSAAAKSVLSGVTKLAKILESSTREGTRFVFGYLGGGELPFAISADSTTFIFAFQVLPIIIVVGALSALLWHWRILKVLVKPVAWVVQRGLGVSSPVGFVAVSNIFLSMIEAPMLIKPYLEKLTVAELFALMTVGLSTVAGGTLIVISAILSADELAFGHVVTATLMNVPGAIAMAHCIFPWGAESRQPTDTVNVQTPYRSSMDALLTGTADGGRVFLNVVALLIVFISLMAMLNACLGLLVPGLTLVDLLAWPAAPFVWLMGIPMDELLAAGGILGTKIAVNELVAYTLLAESFATLTYPTGFTLSFALCGFGNIGSLAILIGGLTAMAPERRDDILRWSPLALWAAFLTNCMTGAVAFIASGLY